MNTREREAHQQTHGGFSVIELLIGLAILAILAAAALPAYKDFSIRAKVAECISTSAPPRLLITMYHDQNGRWPQDAEELATATAGSVTGNGTGISPYCSGIRFDTTSPLDGTFQVVVDGAALDPDLSLAMIAPDMVPLTDEGDAIAWDCRAGATEAELIKYLPEACRD